MHADSLGSSQPPPAQLVGSPALAPTRGDVRVPAHGLPAHALLLRDLTHAHALRVEAHDIVVVGQPPRPKLLAQQLVFRRLDCSVLAAERCPPSGNVSTPSQKGILLGEVAIENQTQR
jgi:hypothetical protein